MNKLQFIVYPAIAALSLFSAVAAHADDITPDNSATQKWSHTKTRDQVRDELFQARADGSIKVWSTQYDPIRNAPVSIKTRDQVRADVVTERAQQVADYGSRMYGEDSGSFYLSQIQPARTVGPVLAKTAK